MNTIQQFIRAQVIHYVQSYYRVILYRGNTILTSSICLSVKFLIDLQQTLLSNKPGKYTNRSWWGGALPEHD